MSGDPLRRLLRSVDVPDADGARDRAWTAVSAAFAADRVGPALDAVSPPDAAAARERAWSEVSAAFAADRVGPALDAVSPPDAAAARERAWTAVAAELRAQRMRPSRRGRRRRARAAALAVAVVVLGAAVAASATPPGAAVRGFVVRVLGREAPPPRAPLGPLPPGRLLVTSPAGAWVVARDGERRRLGPYAGAAWSPRGLYAVVWRGDVVRAVAPNGRVAWTLRTPGRVASAAWSPDGFRIAYRRAGGLGVVAGDGTGARVLAARVAPAGPAWRPGSAHVLAWVDAHGRIVVRDVDTGVPVWGWSGRIGGARDLAWSADGRRLLVRTRAGLLLFDLRANRVRRVRLAAGTRVLGAAWAPRGRRLAVVVRRASADLSDVVIADSARGIARAVPIFSTTGRLGAPAWSPDGRRVLVRWADADEWLLLPAVGGPARPAAARIVAIGGVARRFGGAPVVRGWCCSR